MALMYIDIQVDGTINNIFAIPKHVIFLAGGYTKVLKSIPQINNMIHTYKGRNKIRTICGYLHSNMFLRIPTHSGFIGQMKYTCNGTTSEVVTE